jgi:hypothetical protein
MYNVEFSLYKTIRLSLFPRLWRERKLIIDPVASLASSEIPARCLRSLGNPSQDLVEYAGYLIEARD